MSLLIERAIHPNRLAAKSVVTDVQRMWSGAAM